MIRPFTCVCALLAGGSGLYLYSEKHRTTLLDQQISKIVEDTQHIRERTAMLRAEWALLNQPDRLQGLAQRFLPQLQPMAPTQFVQLASLGKRLPLPGPETPPHPIVTPATAPSLVGQASGSGAAGSGAPGSATPGNAMPAASAEGVAIAQADIRQSTAHRVARAAGAHDAVQHHETQLADAGDASAPDADDASAVAAARRPAAHVVHDVAARHVATHQTAPTRLAAYAYAAPSHSRPAFASVSYARPPMIAAAAWRPVHATWASPRPATYAGTPAAGGSSIGSALGTGRSTLAAPVPLSDGN